MKITVKKSIIVTPEPQREQHPGSSTLWLSNIDVIMPINYHTRTLYFYRPTSAVKFSDLETGLSRALAAFYPLAGRLKMDDGNRIGIECSGEGALLVEAEADCDLDELKLGGFVPRSEFPLTLPVDYSKGIPSYPLFLVQVTRFKCGGICVGIANDHHVADGISSVHYINAWADFTRGSEIAVQPFFDRTLLRARDPPRVDFDHGEYKPPIKLKYPPPSGSETEMRFSVLKVTREQINALKDKCDGVYSSYLVVAGHAWKSVAAARGLPEDQDSMLHVLVDGRQRLQPPLPKGYFGNAVFTAAPIASYGELTSSPLKDVVGKIHDSLVNLDDKFIRSGLDFLGSQSNTITGSSPFKSPNLAIISWARMPFYEADFGFGRPEYVGVGELPSEGKTIILPPPAAANDGSLMYAISLPEEEMKIFEKMFLSF